MIKKTQRKRRLRYRITETMKKNPTLSREAATALHFSRRPQRVKFE